MSRNGSGVYNLPAGNPVVTGTTIASTWANNTMNDIAAALTDSVAADGQTPMTGDLDMNTNKIINLDPATVAGNAVEYSQFVSATTTSVAITGGTINGTTIGATTPATGRFTTLESTGTLTVGTTASISGNTTVGGTLTVTGAGTFSGTGALKIPVGTTAEQPTPVTGMIRYNSTTSEFEGYRASSWGALGGVTSVTAGTGISVSAATGAITITNTSPAVTAGEAKAWVRYAGSTGTIASSYNVSSITINGTGNWTVNITNAFPNANYAVVAQSNSDAVSNRLLYLGNTITTTTFDLVYQQTNISSGNPTIICAAAFS